ncbi:MAG: 5-(carboxyamino)imidazole ribonucleotide synthase [Ilumatobacteraceae bacterium]
MTRTLGVMGGGQLGMYFVRAARTLGFRTVVLDPDPLCPASRNADEHIIAPYDSTAALMRMASLCEAVTVEFENVPCDSLEQLARRIRVAPGADAVAVAQDRRAEKRFLRSSGIPVAGFEVIENDDDVARIVSAGMLDGGTFGAAVLKTATMGYDGKGQVRIDGPDGLRAAWDSMSRVPCVLERMVPLEAEMSVIIVRTADGEVASFAPATNMHMNGVLDSSVVPSGDALVGEAGHLAARVADELGYVGVMGVEFFVSDGRLLVNEIAPRPHNSGHWTIDGAVTSQFEQQVRVLAGLPVADLSMNCGGAAMVNLLGDMWSDGEPDWSVLREGPGVHLHLYGKKQARPGRKMGHLTVLAETAEEALHRAMQLRASTITASGK